MARKTVFSTAQQPSIKMSLANSMEFSFGDTINGRLGSADATSYGINPAAKERLYDVPTANEADLNDAVDFAQEAFDP
ncbi:hypothetical protein ACLMJK_002718 [Lecanora helva]